MSRLQRAEFHNVLHWAKGGLATYRSIQTEGWRPTKWGVWGNGIYFATDTETADLYEDFNWGDVCFAADVVAKRAMVLEVKRGEGFDEAVCVQYPYWARKMGLGLGLADSMTYRQIGDNLRDMGIQAVVVRELPKPTMGPGGNQVCVLDTECIRNLRLHKARKGTAESRRRALWLHRNPVLGPPLPDSMYEAKLVEAIQLNSKPRSGRITSITVA